MFRDFKRSSEWKTNYRFNKKRIQRYRISIIDDLRVAKVNASDYGVPQNRERMIIVGVDAERYDNTQQILSRFYGEILPEYKVSRKITVREAIGDLPACRPVL